MTGYNRQMKPLVCVFSPFLDKQASSSSTDPCEGAPGNNRGLNERGSITEVWVWRWVERWWSLRSGGLWRGSCSEVMAKKGRRGSSLYLYWNTGWDVNDAGELLEIRPTLPLLHYYLFWLCVLKFGLIMRISTRLSSDFEQGGATEMVVLLTEHGHEGPRINLLQHNVIWSKIFPLCQQNSICSHTVATQPNFVRRAAVV